ncbi:MAG: hypothetical protein ABWX73_01235 [Marmoricola sp.]
MTTQEIGHDLGELFERSPASLVHTSAAALIAFGTGLVALLGAPFPLMLAVSLGLSVLALVSSVIGLAQSSRPEVAGSLLASIGLVLSLATFSLIGLRYLGIDTTLGDWFVPALVDWLTALNDLVPSY